MTLDPFPMALYELQLRLPLVNPFKPFPEFSGKYVLYAQDYGFHQGNIVYRGAFIGNGDEQAFNVSLSPGESGVGSVFLNEELLGSGEARIGLSTLISQADLFSAGQVQAKSGFNEVNVSLPIQKGTVRIKEKNIIVSASTNISEVQL